MRKKAPAKINTFLKITGKRDNYHELASRFVRVDSLCDDVTFELKKTPSEAFTLYGDFGCETKKNTIFKAYKALCKAGFEKKLTPFFQAHHVHVEKRIPEFAGLGGGSSDAASFMLLCNEILDLALCKEALSAIGEQVGADVPFFISEQPSANVTGIGEIVIPYDEKVPSFEIATPKIQCSTQEVFKAFREHYWERIDTQLAKKMLEMSSEELCHKYKASVLNDLFLPAIYCHPSLEKYLDEGWMMSGSGSTMFRQKL